MTVMEVSVSTARKDLGVYSFQGWFSFPSWWRPDFVDLIYRKDALALGLVVFGH